MHKKISVFVVASVILAVVHLAEAQQPGRVRRIGFLFSGSKDQPHLGAFRQGLRELGYVEGNNIVIEYRYAEGKLERLTELTGELVGLKVDIIVTTSGGAARAAQRVTKTIPIVMTTSGDPVGTGLIGSLARPGGNITGLTVLTSDLAAKRLELLKESFPKISRVAVLWNPAVPSPVIGFKETQAAAQAFSLNLQSLEIRVAEDIEGAFLAMRKVRSNALLIILDPLTTFHSKKIVELGAKSGLPAMYPTRQFVEEGGVMAYGVNTADLYQRAAIYVDKILKGTDPADLPVEQPTKFEFIVNLKAAKQIGLTIPPNVLARADRVIK